MIKKLNPIPSSTEPYVNVVTDRDITDFAKTSDLPDTSELAAKSDLNNYATKEELSKISGNEASEEFLRSLGAITIGKHPENHVENTITKQMLEDNGFTVDALITTSGERHNLDVLAAYEGVTESELRRDFANSQDHLTVDFTSKFSLNKKVKALVSLDLTWENFDLIESPYFGLAHFKQLQFPYGKVYKNEGIKVTYIPQSSTCSLPNYDIQHVSTHVNYLNGFLFYFYITTPEGFPEKEFSLHVQFLLELEHLNWDVPSLKELIQSIPGMSEAVTKTYVDQQLAKAVTEERLAEMYTEIENTFGEITIRINNLDSIVNSVNNLKDKVDQLSTLVESNKTAINQIGTIAQEAGGLANHVKGLAEASYGLARENREIIKRFHTI